jgi:hypothetical protein
MLELAITENSLDTARLSLRVRYLSRISKVIPSTIDITGLFQPERERVEDFIKGVYADAYGAKISVSYPVLMSVRDAENNILAAVGFRYAEDEPLFLEQYTGKPIDHILQSPRSRIVEIGNLASAGGGASVFLFAALASYLHSKGIEYAAVTGTDYLHGVFKKMGLKPREICEAKIDALSERGQDWGTYYDTRPRVLAGSVADGVKRLKKTLGAEYHDARPRLYPRLHWRSKQCKA